MVDFDNIDMGIRNTVQFLDAHGFKVIESTDGRSGRGRFPIVKVIIDNLDEHVREAMRLRKLLLEAGLMDDKVRIKAVYDLADGKAVIEVSGLSDRDFERKKWEIEADTE